MTKRQIVIFILFIRYTLSSQLPPDCLQHPSLKSEDSSQIRMTRLRSNSDQSDFSPQRVGKTLYFVSGRNNVTGVEYKDENNNNEITDIYSVKMSDSLHTGRTISLPGKINSKFYEGPFALTKNGETIFLTANDKRSTMLKIFSSQKEKGLWTAPIMLPICRDSFSYCHPALSINEDTLWFSANLTGGKGGMDLYYSPKIAGEWQAPQNAGEINTPSNELFPFASLASYIYFASERAAGVGGMDLYRYSKRTQLVELLKHPFNSSGDDFGIWLDSTQQQGYFSTNRNSRYKDDIYHFVKAVPDFTGAKTLVLKKTFCYTFFEEGTQQLNDSANFEFEWSFGDGLKKTGLRAKHCYSQPGEYNVELNILQKVSGEIFSSQASYKLVVDTPAYIGISGPDTARVSDCVELKCFAQGLKDYQVSTTYWSFGDGKYNTGPEVNHIYRKPGEYTLTLLVIAKHKTENKEQKFKVEKKIISYQ